MAGTMAALRRRVMTPSTSNTTLEARGFHRKSADAQSLLESAGVSFLTGYAYGMEAVHPLDAEGSLQALPARHRGIAYEGAMMAFAIRGAAGVRHRPLTREFLAGRAAEHVYLVHSGGGDALGRLPRFLWNRVISAFDDPILQWLMLDGYGFHQAYFRTKKYVHHQYVQPDLRWPTASPPGFPNRVMDQGIGRALWFVHGTDLTRIADAIEAFPASRHADLYGGASQGATYLGGAEEADLRAFKERARHYLPQVAQASAYAALARQRAGLLTDETDAATEILAGATAREAAQACLDTLPEPDERTASGEPAFEVWRQRTGSFLLAG